MAALGLELNDAGIVAVREGERDEPAVPESPGYAIVDGGSLLVGAEARRKARLSPKLTHTRFWDALDTEPLERPFPADLSRADLAHAHLSAVRESLAVEGDADTVLAAPGWYSLDQLGLILGMARACGLPVHGLIDSALAAAATVDEGPALIHLDLHLHRVAAARILRSDQLVREHTVVDDAHGLVRLHDLWARRIAERFVRATRFDPLHAASSEQSLYDALPGWLERLQDENEIAVSLEASDRLHTVEITRDDLVDAAAGLYEAVVTLARSVRPVGEPATLVLSHRLAALPGLTERLFRDVSESCVVLRATAAAAGALHYEEPAPSDDPDAVRFRTRLRVAGRDRGGADPARAREESAAVAAPARHPERGDPTHVLYRGTAHAIAPEPFVLGIAIPEGARGLNLTGDTAGISRLHCRLLRIDDLVVVEDRSKYGTFLNGKRVQDKAALATGDRLRLGTPGIEVQLIEVAG